MFLNPISRDSLTPEERNCYYADEFHLELFEDYTMVNCWMESLINRSKSEEDQNCIPWNMPNLNSYPCKPLEQRKFFENFAKFDLDQVIYAKKIYKNQRLRDST